MANRRIDALMQSAQRHHVEGRLAQALADLVQAADQGAALAAFNAAEFYYTGLGTAVNYETSLAYYVKALTLPAGRYGVPGEHKHAALGNLAEMLNTHKAAMTPEARAALHTASSSQDKTNRAIACLCLGLNAYDAGDRSTAARYYQRGAQAAPTGTARGEDAAQTCRRNREWMSGDAPPPEPGEENITVHTVSGRSLDEINLPLPQCAARSTRGAALKQCARCHSVRYCGPACQRAHWPQHKAECRRAAATATAAT